MTGLSRAERNRLAAACHRAWLHDAAVIRTDEPDIGGAAMLAAGRTGGGFTMYGTVAKTHVKPENREQLREVSARWDATVIPGYVSSHVLWENDGDVGWLFVIFEDRESYDRNADDPAQHERYMEWRGLMEADPEWHDGEIEAG